MSVSVTYIIYATVKTFRLRNTQDLAIASSTTASSRRTLIIRPDIFQSETDSANASISTYTSFNREVPSPHDSPMAKSLPVSGISETVDGSIAYSDDPDEAEQSDEDEYKEEPDVVENADDNLTRPMSEDEKQVALDEDNPNTSLLSDNELRDASEEPFGSGSFHGAFPKPILLKQSVSKQPQMIITTSILELEEIRPEEEQHPMKLAFKGTIFLFMMLGVWYLNMQMNRIFKLLAPSLQVFGT